MTRILAAVDSTATAAPVLASAKAMAGLLGAEMTAVHVREDVASGAAEAARVAASLFSPDLLPLLLSTPRLPRTSRSSSWARDGRRAAHDPLDAGR
jgi:hypothetical protein